MLHQFTPATFHRTLIWIFVVLVAGRLALPTKPVRAGQTETFDLVIENGRVIDPESGLDAIRSIGIRAGRIEEISAGELEGRETIDATGLVVAPGFIDLHAHGQDPFSSRLQALDGVTTALELEGGVFPVTQWYADREGRASINFGATVSMGGFAEAFWAPTDLSTSRFGRPDEGHGVPGSEQDSIKGLSG